jgi:hypothetical protein
MICSACSAVGVTKHRLYIRLGQHGIQRVVAVHAGQAFCRPAQFFIQRRAGRHQPRPTDAVAQIERMTTAQPTQADNADIQYGHDFLLPTGSFGGGHAE